MRVVGLIKEKSTCTGLPYATVPSRPRGNGVTENAWVTRQALGYVRQRRRHVAATGRWRLRSGGCHFASTGDSFYSAEGSAGAAGWRGVASQMVTPPVALSTARRWPLGLNAAPHTGPLWPRRLSASC